MTTTIHDNNITFFNNLRRSQLQCNEDYQIIIGDLNTTLDTKMDKLGNNCDNHWRTRCAYRMNNIPEYNLMIKHLLHESMTDICNKGVIEKA